MKCTWYSIQNSNIKFTYFIYHLCSLNIKSAFSNIEDIWDSFFSNIWEENFCGHVQKLTDKLFGKQVLSELGWWMEVKILICMRKDRNILNTWKKWPCEAGILILYYNSIKNVYFSLKQSCRFWIFVLIPKMRATFLGGLYR